MMRKRILFVMLDDSDIKNILTRDNSNEFVWLIGLFKLCYKSQQYMHLNSFYRQFLHIHISHKQSAKQVIIKNIFVCWQSPFSTIHILNHLSFPIIIY